MKNKKRDLNKVGRPKLADKDLKVNSYIMCLMGLVLVMCLMIGGIFSLTNINAYKLRGTSDYKTRFNEWILPNSYCDVWISDNRFYQATYNWKCNNAGVMFLKAKLKSSALTYVKNYPNFTYSGSHRVDKLLKAEKSLTPDTTYKVGYGYEGKVRWITFKTPKSGNKYAIVFHKNSDKAKGIMYDQQVVFGSKTAISSNKFTLSGYDFVGWKAWRNQDNKWYGYNENNKLGWYDESQIERYYYYKNGEKVGRTASAGRVVHMYAVWNKIKPYYEIRFNANGGAGSMTNQIITYDLNTALKANTFTKSGYKFVGWKAWRSQDDKWYGYNKNNKLGWYKKSDIKKYYVYKDQQKVAKITKCETYVIMYAMWKK